MNDLEVEVGHQVTTITLNRPEVLNALNPEMQQGLQDAFDAFAADRSQRVAVLRAEGRGFCAGSDLKVTDPPPYPKNGYGGLAERYDLFKPVIAAVNGLALGGGFELVLACDLVIAADTASFGLPEPRIGSTALGGGIHRLVREIGRKAAMGVLLAGQRLSAVEAKQLGLVNEVVAPDELGAAVDRWVGEILKAAPTAIRATKEAALKGLDESNLAAAMKAQAGYPEWIAHFKSPNAREGGYAFVQKRAPQWVD